ncbi:MAG: hypothetical protein ACJA2W_004069, partial [Planctomycetota bacterium]
MAFAVASQHSPDLVETVAALAFVAQQALSAFTETVVAFVAALEQHSPSFLTATVAAFAFVAQHSPSAFTETVVAFVAALEQHSPSFLTATVAAFADVA